MGGIGGETGVFIFCQRERMPSSRTNVKNKRTFHLKSLVVLFGRMLSMSTLALNNFFLGSLNPDPWYYPSPGYFLFGLARGLRIKVEMSGRDQRACQVV